MDGFDENIILDPDAEDFIIRNLIARVKEWGFMDYYTAKFLNNNDLTIDEQDYPKILNSFDKIATEINQSPENAYITITGEWALAKWLELANKFYIGHVNSNQDWKYYNDLEYLSSFIKPVQESCEFLEDTAQNESLLKNVSPEEEVSPAPVSKFSLTAEQLSIVKQVAKHAIIYDKSIKNKCKQSRDEAFKQIAIELYGLEAVSQNPNIVNTLDSEWLKIRRNYSYYYKNNKLTNYEELFGFLKPNISKRSKSESLASDVSAEQSKGEKDFSNLVDSLSLECDGDSVDNVPYEDHSDLINVPIPKSQKSSKSTKVEELSSLDIYCMALERAF